MLGFYFSRKRATRLNIQNAQRKLQKEKNKERVLTLLKKQERITNDDVENLLDVSHTTATNYLDALEQEGKVSQKGTVGRSVYYQ